MEIERSTASAPTTGTTADLLSDLTLSTTYPGGSAYTTAQVGTFGGNSAGTWTKNLGPKALSGTALGTYSFVFADSTNGTNISGTTYDDRIRAFDKRTGALLWEGQLPAAGNATPSTYMVNGVQYIVIAVGGNFNGRNQAQFMAFRLPNNTPAKGKAPTPADQ